MEHPTPPRFGDWSSVNRHLTAGGTVEHAPRENPYLPYIKQLMEKHERKLNVQQIRSMKYIKERAQFFVIFYIMFIGASLICVTFVSFMYWNTDSFNVMTDPALYRMLVLPAVLLAWYVDM